LAFALVAATYLAAATGSGIAGLALYVYSGRKIGLLLVSLLVGHLLGIGIGVRSLRFLRRVSRRAPGELGLSTDHLFAKVRQGLGIYLLALPGYLFFAVLLTALSQRYGFKYEQPTVQNIVRQVTGSPGAVVLFFLLAAVAAPVWEELIFRGLLYSALRARWGMWPGILVTAFLFALMHETGRVLHDPRTFLFPILYLGCVLAYVREKTESVVPGMAVHALHNVVALTVSLMFRQPV
jgi:membrane protease YdiL (CAAX protease family)